MWTAKAHLIDSNNSRTWELEGGNNNNEESLNSGIEGEWKLHKEDVSGTREFAMREWGDDDNRKQVTEGGEWKLQEGKIWGVELTVTPEDHGINEGGIKETVAERKRWKRKFCCCDHLTEIKIFITIFGLINLGIMASGGVGFGLGLSNTHKEETFKYLMIGSSCLMCWGLLASTMDILALLGLYQGKKALVLPWLLWYVLEVITYLAVALVFIVYTEKFYILPVLLKTVITIITWINVKRIYSNSFGTFYTKETEAIIY